MYYIRKLSKTSTVAKIKSLSSVNEMSADLLKQELATTDNKLSFWKCESLQDKRDTLKAIILSGTKIDNSSFIIVDDNMLDNYNIIRDDSEKGKTAYKGYENLHVNFCELSYQKIGNIVTLMKKSLDNKQYGVVLSRDEVKDCIREVCKAGLLNINEAHEDLLADIVKYGLNGEDVVIPLKLKPEFKMIESPITVVLPDGTENQYDSGLEVTQALFYDGYKIKKIRAVNNGLEIYLKYKTN